MRKGRVLRIAHFSIGRVNRDSANGVDKTIYYLAKTQAALGHEVAVFSLTEKTALPITGVDITTYRPMQLPISLGNRLDDLLVARSPLNLPGKLMKDVLTWDPDILHLHFVHVPQNVVLAGRAHRAGIPYTVTINGGLSTVAQRRNGLLKQVFRMLVEGRYLEKAAFLHVISDQDLEGLRSYGIHNTAILAPNGIDLDSLPHTLDPGALTRKYPQLAGKRVFMFLGRLDPEQKGLDILVEAFGLAEAMDTALLVVGPDWRSNRQRLVQIARASGIANRVLFTGPVFGQEKHNFLAGSDVFVHPSRWEAGVPFSVLEAAASAKPTLLSSGADPSELFRKHSAGLHVETHPASVAKAIERFAEMDGEALGAMGGHARSLVERDFAWEPIARTVVEAYRTHHPPP